MKVFIVITIFAAIFGTLLAVDFQINNKVGLEIWVGIQGNDQKPALEGGGFKLGNGQSRTISSPPDWAGRFWARTFCNTVGNNHCATGDCGNKVQCNGNGGAPPATVAEITLKGDRGQDFYDISLVDGFNVKASIQPIGGSGSSCRRVGCDQDVNQGCPNDLRVEYKGKTVACQSYCTRYNTDQYCCRGAYDKPDTCKVDTWPPNNSASYFKQRCPDAYSYAYDDKTSTFTCISEKYQITFG